jgi:PAS domain-containing protein
VALCAGKSAGPGVCRPSGPPDMTTLWFATGEVASMLGVSPDTLRAWERRHRALTPARSPSGQRRYTLEDVAHLRQIKYERHAHRLSLRLATMTAQGLVTVAEGESPGEVRPETPPPTAIADPIRVVLNLIREIVLVLDEEGSVVWANLAFAKFADRLASRITGSKFLDFVDPYDRAKAVQAYAPPVRRRQGWELNLRGSRRHGLFSFDCCPVASDSGPLLLLVGADQATGQARS